MMRHPRLAIAAAALLSAAALPFSTAAQPGAGESQPTLSAPRRVGLYVVRPGDTLRGISGRYSGGIERWEENWRLNPELADPHRILPGQRLRILLAAEVPTNSARVVRVSRLVEEKPQPNPWVPSNVDHLLIEADGLRTRQASSSELLFAEDVVLRVTENSLVFLERIEQQLTGVPREAIQIVAGQADLGARQKLARASDIEIIFGDARANPLPGEDGSLATRARNLDAGGAQLMVYEGKSSLEARGGKVEVATGMGSTVQQGSPPSPPEKLLPAPALTSPASGSAWNRPDPLFSWEAVQGAASYVLEICRDPDCGALERRVLGLSEPRYDPSPLPIGDYYWRSTAVASSGLDGYPAATAAFAIASDRIDRQPPVGSLAAEGNQVRYGEHLVLGPGATLVAEASDAEGEIAGWTYLLDGAEVSYEAWRQDWEPGAHQAEVLVSDEAGNTTRLGPLPFISDPQPPELSWEVGGEELVQRRGRPEWELSPVSRWKARRLARQGVVFAWSSDGGRWLTLGRPDRSRRGEVPADPGRASGDSPQVFLRAPAGDPFAGDSPVRLGRGQVLHLAAEDGGCGVDELSFGIAFSSGPDGRRRPSLWIRAVDLLGNARSQEWPLTE